MVEELPDGVEDDGAAEHRVGTVGVGAERLEELHGELGLLERGVFLVEEEEAFGELHADDGVERFGLGGLKKRKNRENGTWMLARIAEATSELWRKERWKEVRKRSRSPA